MLKALFLVAKGVELQFHQCARCVADGPQRIDPVERRLGSTSLDDCHAAAAKYPVSTRVVASNAIESTRAMVFPAK